MLRRIQRILGKDQPDEVKEKPKPTFAYLRADSPEYRKYAKDKKQLATEEETGETRTALPRSPSILVIEDGEDKGKPTVLRKGELLGEGRDGKVYQFESSTESKIHVQAEKKVVKTAVYKLEKTTRERIQKRIEREAEATQLIHGTCETIIEVGEQEITARFFMKKIPGSELAAILKEFQKGDDSVFIHPEFKKEYKNPLELKRVALKNKIKTFLSIFKKIRELHQHKLVHVDLHFGNILLDKHTKEIYLIDFGLATPIAPDGDARSDLQLNEELQKKRIEQKMTIDKWQKTEQKCRPVEAYDYFPSPHWDVYTSGAFLWLFISTDRESFKIKGMEGYEEKIKELNEHVYCKLQDQWSVDKIITESEAIYEEILKDISLETLLKEASFELDEIGKHYTEKKQHNPLLAPARLLVAEMEKKLLDLNENEDDSEKAKKLLEYVIEGVRNPDKAYLEPDSNPDLDRMNLNPGYLQKLRGLIEVVQPHEQIHSPSFFNAYEGSLDRNKLLRGLVLFFVGAVIIAGAVAAAVASFGISLPASLLFLKLGVSSLISAYAIGAGVLGAGAAATGISCVHYRDKIQTTNVGNFYRKAQEYADTLKKADPFSLKNRKLG